MWKFKESWKDLELPTNYRTHQIPLGIGINDIDTQDTGDVAFNLKEFTQDTGDIAFNLKESAKVFQNRLK